MTDYRTIEVDLTGITPGDILSYDSTSKKFKRVGGANGQVLTRVGGKWIAAAAPSGGGGGGGGGGLPDPPMVQLSKPYSAALGSEMMGGWDGLDYVGAPMPNGFARAILERSSASPNTSSTSIGSFDLASQADTNPYVPAGWTAGPSSGFKALGHKLQATAVGEGTPLGGLNVAYVDAPSSIATVTSVMDSNVGGV